MCRGQLSIRHGTGERRGASEPSFTQDHLPVDSLVPFLVEHYGKHSYSTLLQMIRGQQSSDYNCQGHHIFLISMAKPLLVEVCFCVLVHIHPSVRSENGFIILK